MEREDRSSSSRMEKRLVFDLRQRWIYLEHRSYIKRIIGCREETERADHARGKVYYITFEDIDGKKHTLKFSYESWALEFQKWFEKQTYEKKM